jgi:hypothetical protein
LEQCVLLTINYIEMDKFEQHIKRMKGLRDVYEAGTGQHNILSMLINECEAALCQPLVSGELNCEHDWLVDMYDHFGFPASRFCDKCNTREAI